MVTKLIRTITHGGKNFHRNRKNSGYKNAYTSAIRRKKLTVADLSTTPETINFYPDAPNSYNNVKILRATVKLQQRRYWKFCHSCRNLTENFITKEYDNFFL